MIPRPQLLRPRCIRVKEERQDSTDVLLNGLNVVLCPHFEAIAVCAIRIGASVTDKTQAVAQAGSALKRIS